MLAMFVEAIVSAIKPLWKDGGRMTITEIVSIVIGIVVAIAMKIDLFSSLVELDIGWNSPKWLEYLFYGMTGIAIGRGPSFVYDVWQRVKNWSGITLPEAVTMQETTTTTAEVTEDIDVDLNIANWTVEQLREFCILNDIPAEGCETKGDYMDAIEHGGIISDPPPDQEEIEED